jgi:Protein of unknown function (DUF3119)
VRAPGRASAAPTVASIGSSSPKSVIPADPRLGLILLTVAAGLGPVAHLWGQSALHALLGGFLTFQSTRVRFRFADKELDVVFVQPGDAEEAAEVADTSSSGENKLQGGALCLFVRSRECGRTDARALCVTGGANAWSLSSITNWEFWWPGFPVLVFYKENQTRPEGQPHFFPIIMDGKVLYETMLKRMPPSLNPKPSPEEWSLDLALRQTSIGRALREKLSPEQAAWAKETKGIPFVDKY